MYTLQYKLTFFFSKVVNSNPLRFSYGANACDASAETRGHHNLFALFGLLLLLLLVLLQEHLSLLKDKTTKSEFKDRFLDFSPSRSISRPSMVTNACCLFLPLIYIVGKYVLLRRLLLLLLL